MHVHIRSFSLLPSPHPTPSLPKKILLPYRSRGPLERDNGGNGAQYHERRRQRVSLPLVAPQFSTSFPRWSNREEKDSYCSVSPGMQRTPGFLRKSSASVVLEWLFFVLAGGPAEKAGLQQLDTVLQLNEKPVEHWKCVELAHEIR